jgi:hypothetical protein
LFVGTLLGFVVMVRSVHRIAQYRQQLGKACPVELCGRPHASR